MYAPSWGYGGPVRMFFDYARWMSREFDVVVLTGDVHHDGSHIPNSEVEGVEVRRNRVFLPQLTKRSIYLLSPRMFLEAARRIHSAPGPVIVHFYEVRGVVPLYALLLKVVFRDRVTLVHSAFGSLHYKPSFRRKLHDALFMKGFVKLVRIGLVQNEHERDTYDSLCIEHGDYDKPQVVLLPLHLDELPCDPDRYGDSGKNQRAVRETRKAHSIPEHALVFLFLGRLHPAKGLVRLVDAFLEFSRSGTGNELLVIVGRDDGFQSALQDYIASRGASDRIRIVNNVYEGRFDYYFLADIFLGFPTIFEETMLSSVEALACGTPLVVSREADIPFVAEQSAGMVIDFDVPTAAAAMANVRDNLATFQRNARRVAARHFTGKQAAMRLSSILGAAGDSVGVESEGLSAERLPHRRSPR